MSPYVCDLPIVARHTLHGPALPGKYIVGAHCMSPCVCDLAIVVRAHIAWARAPSRAGATASQWMTVLLFVGVEYLKGTVWRHKIDFDDCTSPLIGAGIARCHNFVTSGQPL